MELRVAGYQMSVGRDVDDNVWRILGAVDFASKNSAEILLTPEGSLSGYTPEFDARTVAAALTIVTEHARAGNVGLALGTCFVEEDGKRYNQIRFYTPDGRYLGFHGKTLRCGSVDGAPGGEVDDYAGVELRTFPWRDGVCLGGLICNDMWANPECTPMPDTHLSQQLSKMGANVILHAVNGGRDGSRWSEVAWRYHESNLRMRARAGRVWIVTADNARPEELPCSAPSGVIDPSGNFVCRTVPKGEQYFTYTIRSGHGRRPADRAVPRSI